MQIVNVWILWTYVSGIVTWGYGTLSNYLQYKLIYSTDDSRIFSIKHFYLHT